MALTAKDTASTRCLCALSDFDAGNTSRQPHIGYDNSDAAFVEGGERIGTIPGKEQVCS